MKQNISLYRTIKIYMCATPVWLQATGKEVRRRRLCPTGNRLTKSRGGSEERARRRRRGRRERGREEKVGKWKRRRWRRRRRRWMRCGGAKGGNIWNSLTLSILWIDFVWLGDTKHTYKYHINRYIGLRMQSFSFFWCTRGGGIFWNSSIWVKEIVFSLFILQVEWKTSTALTCLYIEHSWSKEEISLV